MKKFILRRMLPAMLALSIMTSVMVVPAFRNASRECGGNRLIRDGKALRIGVIAAYLLMAVGSVVSV